MPWQNVITTFLTAVISAIGAFVPIFVLMYIHYQIRKGSYKKTLFFWQDVRRFHERSKKDYQKMLNELCGALGITESELLKTTNSDGITLELLRSGISLKQKIIMEDSAISKVKTDEKYLSSYNFRRYVADILNRKFPDTHSEIY